MLGTFLTLDVGACLPAGARCGSLPRFPIDPRARASKTRASGRFDRAGGRSHRREAALADGA